MEISDDLLKKIKLISTDPAMSSVFMARNPEFMTLMADMLRTARKQKITQAFPETDAITAMEIAIFDNWPNGKKPARRPHRYGFKIGATTDQDVDFTDRWPLGYLGDLMTGEAVLKKVAELSGKASRKTGRYTLSEDYAAFVALMVDVVGESGTTDGLPEPLFGLIAEKSEGTYYPENKVLVVQPSAGGKFAIKSAHIWTGYVTPMELPAFSQMDAGSNPLKGNAVLQSRYAPAGKMKGWATPFV